MGGLSGRAVLPVAVRMVYQVKSAVSIPILGMGGIADGDDAVELLLAGADLVAVGTACFTDPLAPIKTIEGISRYLTDNEIRSVTELTYGVVLN
jgi:dihydroorotate dehydrogenase (NAD+) catalytic subunit